jgi:hypothetical protein
MTVESPHHALDSAPSEPYLDEVAVPRRVRAGGADLVREMGESLESVVYYEHPFTRCGLLVVMAEGGGEPIPALLGRIYCQAPRVPLHCLRLLFDREHRRVVREAVASRLEGELGDLLRPVILTGSLGRGQAVPGKSDLLDAVVVLRRGALDDREAYERGLRAMVA